MCKKVLIATLAVLVGLAVVKGTKIGSYLRMAKKDAAAWVNKQVEYETEIKRLRYEVERLEKEDAVCYDGVAEQRVNIRKKEQSVARDRAEVEKLHTRLTTLRSSLASLGEDDTQLISYNGNKYSRTEVEKQIDIDFNTYKQLKAAVASQETFIKSLRTALAQNEEKMANLQRTRQEMLTSLQDLENELVDLRQAQTANANLFDDTAYGRVKQDIAALKDRLAVDKEKLKVRGLSDRGPIEANEQERQRLRLREGDRVYRLHRLRHHDGQTFLIEEVSLPAALFPDLSDNTGVVGRIIALAQEYGILLG
jgi:chromosome segregation ATPase